MITLLRGTDRDRFPKLFNDMHRLRKRVFHDRMGWEVNIIGEIEIDEFDNCNPLYILSHDDAGNTVGCARLLPTTGPNMLSDVFGALLPPGESVRSPLIWESSRFSVDVSASGVRNHRLLRYTTGELLCAMAEVGILAGLEFFVSVTDLYMERILERADCQCDRLGEPVQFGKVAAVAGFWEVGEASLARIRKNSGITWSVINEESAERVVRLAA